MTAISMHQSRIDLSEWLIHFVHKRDPENDPYIYDERSDGERIPFHTDPKKHSRFDVWQIKDDERPLSSDASAFSVLMRILDDGHIRSGWSLRKKRPTIYGPRPACCFTEMPLYALLNYAGLRSNSNAVDVYGIAVRKAELFAAGGRPVIYGLTGHHRELPGKWPRMLDTSCGISQSEQFRYVSMKLGTDFPIDWSHEREWRWADTADRCECPGLPIWAEDEAIHFSKVILIVRTSEESDQVFDKLRRAIDSGCDEYMFPYNVDVLEQTCVLSLDEALANDNRTNATLRIDDLQLRELKVSKPVEPDQQTIERVRSAVDRATEAARMAASSWVPSQEVFGFAYLMIDNSRSPIVQAMLRLGAAEAAGGLGYKVLAINRLCDTGVLSHAECAAEAAKGILDVEFPELSFYVRTVWD